MSRTLKWTNKIGNWEGRDGEKSVISRKLSFFGHVIRKSRDCLEKEIVEGTMPGTRAWRRPRTAWLDNIKSWTGLAEQWTPLTAPRCYCQCRSATLSTVVQRYVALVVVSGAILNTHLYLYLFGTGGSTESNGEPLAVEEDYPWCSHTSFRGWLKARQGISFSSQMMLYYALHNSSACPVYTWPWA